MNINTKINMLYDFIYAKSNEMTDTETQPFDIDTSISIDDIKIKFEGENYDEILGELFSDKFKMIDFDKHTNNLILKKYNDNLSISLYISPYNIDSNLEELNNMNNNDCLFSYILSTLVLTKKTKHIAVPIMNIDVKINQMHDIISQYEEVYNIFMEMISNNQISNILSVRIKESFFKSEQLSSFIKSSNMNIKKLLFQVVHTLAVLQKEYPGFRHNMLNLSNIFVYLKKPENDMYELDGKKYFIPDNDFEIKITNFFLSNIPNKYGSNVDGVLNVPFFESTNNYFDIHCFLNDLLKELEIELDEETVEFLNKVIPEKYRNSKRMYLKENDEFMVPEELLKDAYFKEFKTELSIQRIMSPDNFYTNRKSKKSSIKKSSIKKSSIKKSSTKQRKSSVSGSRTISMKGGATFYHPPNTKYPNNPFISNDNRSVYKKEKGDEKPVEKPVKTVDDDIIMTQTIRKNPSHIRPFKVKPMMTWDPEYKPMPTASYVPKAQAHYPDPKFPVAQNTEIQSTDTQDTDNTESSKESEKTKTESSDDETINSNSYENSTEDKYNKSQKYSKYNKPDDSYKPKHYEPRESRDYKPKTFEPRDSRESRDYKPKTFEPRDSRDYKPNTYEPRDSRDSRESRDYKPRYQPNITEQPFITEQKYNQQNIPPGALHTHPKYSNPAFIPIDNQVMYPPAFVPDLANYFPFNGVPLTKPNELPLQKIYNINLGAPGHNNTILNNIYQDVLPGDPNSYTMNSVYEREQLISMLRNSMIKKYDGEDMTLQAGEQSVMEYIKILDFNPYSLGINKYSKLPLNFLLYTAAYPIRYNLENRNIEIAKQSIGMNVRIYMLSKGALNTNIDANLDSDNFDVWRELKYYKYVKETILKQKISPNFTTMFLYKLDRVSKIDYDELKKIITDHKSYDIILQNLNNNQEINKFLTAKNTELKTLLGKATNTIPTNIAGPTNPATLADIDLAQDSKVSLLCITEAPTSNIIEWGAPTFEKAGIISKQISTGFHTTEVWRSVLFQLVSAMAVLQEKQIYFRNFSFENNVFIKDLFKDPNNTGHWLYKVNNIDMYVPNYGHLVLIDTRHADVNPPTGTTGVFKIVSPIYNNNGTPLPSDTNINNDLKRILNRNNFMPGQLYNNYGMVQPDDKVLDLLEKIVTIANGTPRIADILVECFPEYIHNRVGTLLTIAEKGLLIPTIQPKLTPGKLVAYQYRFDEYMWAIYSKDDGARKKQIYIKTKDKLEIKSVFNHSLVEHPESNNIIQNSEKTFRLNKDSLIDSYNIN